jgi:hypothetical protein
MNSESIEQLEIEIKRLERDKRIEEIKQIKASGRTRWITPTALAILLPMLAGFGLWVVNELKQYSEGYQALRERDTLISESQNLQRQKNSLNIEVTALLALKKHYAEQAKAFQVESEERQKVLDTTYVRARFATAETSYALSHIEGMGPGPDRSALKKIKNDLAGLPNEVARQLREIIDRYTFAVDMIDVSQRTLEAFRATLGLITASDWAVKLEAVPSGYAIKDRNIMILRSRQGIRYYDVDEGRFISEEEIKSEHVNPALNESQE